MPPRTSPSPSRSSGDRSANSGADAAPRTIHRVAFNGGNLAHWALFLPDVDGGSDGTLAHIGAETNSSGKKGAHRLRFKKIRVTSSSARSVHAINGAKVTGTMLREVAAEVFAAKGGYNAVTNNCQHFCYDVIAAINAKYPGFVLDSAVADMWAHRNTIVTVTKYLRG